MQCICDWAAKTTTSINIFSNIWNYSMSLPVALCPLNNMMYKNSIKLTRTVLSAAGWQLKLWKLFLFILFFLWEEAQLLSKLLPQQINTDKLLQETIENIIGNCPEFTLMKTKVWGKGTGWKRNTNYTNTPEPPEGSFSTLSTSAPWGSRWIPLRAESYLAWYIDQHRSEKTFHSVHSE